eukprot:1070324_1
MARGQTTTPSANPSVYPSVSPSRYRYPSTLPTMAPTYYTLPFTFGDCATVYELSMSWGGNVVHTLSTGDMVEFIDPGGNYDVYVGLVIIALKFNYNATSLICDSATCGQRVLFSVDGVYGSADCLDWCFTSTSLSNCHDSRIASAQTVSVQYRSDGSARNINMAIDSTPNCWLSPPVPDHAIGFIVAPTQLPTLSPTVGSNEPSLAPTLTTDAPSDAPTNPSKSPSNAPSLSDDPTMAPTEADNAPTTLNTELPQSLILLFLVVLGLATVICCVLCCKQWRNMTQMLQRKTLANSQDTKHMEAQSNVVVMNKNGVDIAAYPNEQLNSECINKPVHIAEGNGYIVKNDHDMMCTRGGCIDDDQNNPNIRDDEFIVE